MIGASTTRRDFLATGSAALLALGIRPGRRGWTAAPADFLPDPDEAALRALALAAMDAARAAGAAFADIRLNAARFVILRYSAGRKPASMDEPNIGIGVEYGIRAIVDGSWGFSTGAVLTPDGAVATARAAVDAARANRRFMPRTLMLAPAAKLNDATWATPFAVDPLRVSIGEQTELVFEALRASAMKNVRGAFVRLDWRRHTAVFASTEGALGIQRFSLGYPAAGVGASVGEDTLSEASYTLDLAQGGQGYERIRDAKLGAQLREAGEAAVALALESRAPKSVDVGRYDVVFGPKAVAELIQTTLAEAVHLPRALGFLADYEGTSFAAPPLEALGKLQVASPLVTVDADRTRPDGAATTPWDDEGVAPIAYTFIERGKVVDYHGNRETGMELPTRRAQGCSRGVGQYQPAVKIPNLTLRPGVEAVTVDDMIAGTKRGIYIDQAGGSVDQQVMSGQSRARHQYAREIRNGKLGEHLNDAAFQFMTPGLWKGIDALGGAASARSVDVVTDYSATYSSEPSLMFPSSTMSVVPLRVRQMNILNVGRTA